ncbi:hypothetical protein [Limosilactobacillus ingluviei]|uniref:hypothetical protein n=1 Tax=Limosilactobacillus ingluviei TaxID=148604 RepID=UPI0005943DAB|nr:hypothetical protein [Limosilactobacillus ingluviei]
MEKYESLSLKEMQQVVGGTQEMKCYSTSCIRRRAQGAQNAYDFARGFAHGVCQGVGWCN